MTRNIETISKKYGCDVDGLSSALEANKEIEECLKELSIKYSFDAYMTPEIRLSSAVAMTALSIYQNNKVKSKLDNFLNTEIPQEIKNKYSHL